MSSDHKQGGIFFLPSKFHHVSRDLFEGGEVSLVVVRAVVSTKDIKYLLNKSISKLPAEWGDGTVGKIFAARE